MVPICPPVLMTIAAVIGEEGVRATGSGEHLCVPALLHAVFLTLAKRLTLWAHFSHPQHYCSWRLKVKCLEQSLVHSRCSVNESFPPLCPNHEFLQGSSLWSSFSSYPECSRSSVNLLDGG